jgi:hypothetical protein
MNRAGRVALRTCLAKSSTSNRPAGFPMPKAARKTRLICHTLLQNERLARYRVLSQSSSSSASFSTSLDAGNAPIATTFKDRERGRRRLERCLYRAVHIPRSHASLPVLLASVLSTVVWVSLADENGDFRLGAVRVDVRRVGCRRVLSRTTKSW